MFAWITEPICWFICIVYLPYLTFKSAATDDGAHIHYAITWWLLTCLTVVQTIPLIYTLVAYFPFYYEIKLVAILLVMYTRASDLLYRRVLGPIFARHIKSPAALAKQLPVGLQNQCDLQGLHKFGGNFIQNTTDNVQEHGFKTYRLVCAMMIQSATDPVERNSEWEATEMGLASGFAQVAGAAASGVANVARRGMDSMSTSDAILAAQTAQTAMKSSVEMGL